MSILFILIDSALIIYDEMFSWACSIPDDDTVVLTGGMYPLDEGYGYGVALVERYGPYGYVDALPFLNYARFGHGCGYYYKDGEKVRF